MPTRGRGRAYTPARAWWEARMVRFFGDGWPARWWSAVPGALRVDALRVEKACLPPGCPPLRVGFASDLHLGPTTSPALLGRAQAILAEAGLDLLLLGGDFVFLEATEEKAAALAAWVEGIPARWKMAVLGNHDLWTCHDRLERALTAVGVEWIINRGRPLDGEHGAIGVFGLDDPWTGAPDVAAALTGVAGCPVKVGLVHAPDGLPLLPPGAATVLFCGHTHGGQLALPGGVPLYVPGRAGERWPWGRHEVDGTTLLVSRGLGGVEIPVRLFAPPDVWILDLLPMGSGGYGAGLFRRQGRGGGSGGSGGR